MNFFKNSLSGYVVTLVNVLVFFMLYLVANSMQTVSFESLMIGWGIWGIIGSVSFSFLASKLLKKPEVFEPSLVVSLFGVILIPIILYFVSIVFSAYIYNEKQS